MKTYLKSLLLLCLFVLPFGCEDMDDQPVPDNLVVKDFVWKGMNLYYLWQADVPDLADNRFANQSELNAFLEPFANPTTLFNAIRTDAVTDRFSVIYSDYTVLEGVLSGNTLNNGMDFGLKHINTTTDVYGWVRYIIPGSDAATKDIHRGAIFYAIDGIPLTDDNYRALLFSNNETYTVNLADYSSDSSGFVTITPNGQSVTLTKTNLVENPILMSTVINEGTHNIGYLMYNGFYPAYDSQLNSVFGNFLSQNVTDLVLDLRYNSGGSVTTAVKLSSMITGQFPGQVFTKLKGNVKVQAALGTIDYKFAGGLNGLHLNKVYILTSKASASASELVINSLKPYITVVQIGDVTTGKNVASRTLYDSFDYSKNDVNPSHKYAMQPIVYLVADKNGIGNYAAGITPTTSLPEDLDDLGTLGQTDEPLLSEAINQIVANGKHTTQSPGPVNRDFTDAKAMNPLRTELYVEP